MKKTDDNGQLTLFAPEDFGEPATAPVNKKEKTQRPSFKAQTKSTCSVDLPQTHYDHTSLFLRLSKSDFRSKFHLKPQDLAYIESKGMAVIRKHAADFVTQRLAPAFIPNDGKQTPMRGHPVFLAQHATACCCRGCFEKWHHIPAGRLLTPKEQAYAVSVLMTWIEREYEKSRPK